MTRQARGRRRRDPDAFRRLDLTHAAFAALPADQHQKLLAAQMTNAPERTAR